MLRRLIKASAIVIGVGLVVTGCAVTPLKMGSAAIVGNERISIATLDNEATSLNQAVQQYPGDLKLTPTEETQATLTWLIRYQVYEEMARQQGITVSPAQAQKTLSQLRSSLAGQVGLTNPSDTLLLASYGIPPDTSAEFARYLAIATAAGNKLNQAECQAAKALNIQVNPQFGQLDYNQLVVVPAPSSVTRSAGPTTPSSPVATAPAC